MKATTINTNDIVKAMRLRTKKHASGARGTVRRDGRGRRRYNTLPVNRVCETGDDR